MPIQKMVFLTFFSTLVLNAQGIIDEENGNETTTGLLTMAQQLNFFSQQSNEALAPKDINVANTGIFINQIGNGNSANVATQSQISDIQLNQFGNSNKINLNIKAEIIDYKVNQQGNNNLLLEFNTFNNKQLLQRSVEQNGDGQNLVIHGRNSIVDKMKITMEQGSQSIIIRNTN